MNTLVKHIRNIGMFVIIGLACIPSHSAVEVVDYLGRVVRLEKPAERVIALAPHIVENLYSAGAFSKIVGAVDYCDYPKAAKNIPRVGSMNGYSIESIVEKKPDLVIVWNSGHGAKILDKLVKLGFTVYADNPLKLEDVSRSIRDFGILSGTTKVAEEQALVFDRKRAQLKKTYSSKKNLSVLYQVWNKPLQTLNGKHIISDVIRLCGGQNAFHDAIPLAPKVSVESVIFTDPQVIIASGMGESRPEWLNEWLRWPSIAAVKSNNLYFIPPDIIQRHTARMLEGATMMCSQLEQARDRVYK